MRKQLHEIKKLDKGVSLDLHGRMPAVKHNTVLVVIHIRRILESPGTVVDGDGNDPVVLSGGMVHPSRVSLVFRTEEALGITAGLCVLRRRYGLGIFFRLG